MNLKQVATATGGTLVVANSTDSFMRSLADALEGFFKVKTQENKNVGLIVTAVSDRVRATLAFYADGLSVQAFSKVSPKLASINATYTSISKEDIGDLVDALVKFHELNSALIAVNSLK